MVKTKADWILLSIVLILVLLGILILFSVSAPISQNKFGNTYYYLQHQIVLGLIPGLILGFLAFKIDLNKVKKWSLYLFLGNLVLMAMVFLPGIGLSIGGATRWIDLKIFSFQPAELLKITIPLYLTAWLSGLKKQIDKIKLLSFLVILALVSVILILQPDISTLILILCISGAIYFLSNTPTWHSLLMLATGIAILFLLINIAPYRMARFLVFLNPDIDPMGIGYQIKQSLIAIGSGGVLGKGIGLSKQKFGLLPNVVSDSIFSAFCEETGLLGPLVLIILFLALLLKTIKISQQTKNKFFKLLALILGIEIVLQAFLNIGAMTGIVPLTGTPLPFISYGGTHLVVELISIGLLLNISKS